MQAIGIHFSRTGLRMIHTRGNFDQFFNLASLGVIIIIIIIIIIITNCKY